jgi:hypothetical protein
VRGTPEVKPPKTITKVEVMIHKNGRTSHIAAELKCGDPVSLFSLQTLYNMIFGIKMEYKCLQDFPVIH